MAQGSIIKDGGVGKRVVRRARLDGGTDLVTGKRRKIMRSFATKTEATGMFADAGRITVGEYLHEWLDGRKDIRPSNWMVYAALLKSRIIPNLGSILLRAIRPSQVARFLASQNGSPATTNVLRAIFPAPSRTRAVGAFRPRIRLAVWPVWLPRSGKNES